MRSRFVVSLLLVSLASAARAETFSFPGHGFEMTCLDSWEEIELYPVKEELEGLDFGSSRANRAARSRDSDRLLRLRNPYLPKGAPPEITLSLLDPTDASPKELLRKAARRSQRRMRVLSMLGPRFVRMGEFDGALLEVSLEVREDGTGHAVHSLIWIANLDDKKVVITAAHGSDVDVRAIPEIENCVQSLRRIEVD